MSPERKIRIVEEGKLASPKPIARPAARFDVQDATLLVGVVAGEAAALVIWWPTALVLLSLFGFGFTYLIERSRSRGN